MKPAPAAAAAPTETRLSRVFSLLFGAFLGLALLKFGNVAIMERFIEWPSNGWEWLINTWPVAIGLWLLGALGLVGIFAARWDMSAPRWLVALPLVWLGWQFVSATHTLDAALTQATLRHFCACVVCFYLGMFALGRRGNMSLFLLSLGAGLCVVIAVGLEQHFGGLEESRRYFFTYVYPQSPNVPPEFLKKIKSDRIWATLFYPNALAGVLLLLLPAALTGIWLKLATRFTTGARAFLLVLVGGGGLACLYWSGSKGGWLLMLLLGMTALLRAPVATRWKVALIGLVLAGGLAGFALRYAGYFERKATSVSARLDYWRAAFQTVVAHPVFGTGPGTFAIPYQAIKRPESEMARLVHNDYLQQASDSGLVGFLAFAGLVVTTLVRTRPRAVDAGISLRFAVWLGVLGWSLQGVLEFGLYIPALAWSAFSLMGWLLATTTAKPFDKPAPASYAGVRK